MNYKDEDGDLIAIGDQEDLTTYLTFRSFTNLIELCITSKGDTSLYNTAIPR